MYTAEDNKDEAYGGKHTDILIMDPDGDYVCSVPNAFQAAALLSHLNRG